MAGTKGDPAVNDAGSPRGGGGTSPEGGIGGARPEEKEGAEGEAARMRSYALLEKDTMSLYMNFYKHTYARSVLDRKVKELIAIAAALTSGCKNCLEGHLRKAIKGGATRAEISETIAITLGVNAATIVDRSDIAAANLGIDLDAWRIPGEDDEAAPTPTPTATPDSAPAPRARTP